MQTGETKLKISNSRKGQTLECRDPATRSKHISEALKGHPMHQKSELREKRSNLMKRLWATPEYRDKMSKIRKALWSNIAFKEKQLSQMLSGEHSPTKPEQQLESLLNGSFPGEWRYVGNYQVWFGGYNPDFINVNGKKQLIEVFGTYWHNLFDVAKKKEHFRQYGFQTLVIWEDELSNPERVIKKVKSFNRKS